MLKVSKEFPEEVHIKYAYSDDVRRINVIRSVRGRPSLTTHELPRKYSGKIPISEAKKNDLLDLCKSLVIPEVYRGFYEAIPTSRTVKDKLPLPDVQDNESDSDMD